MYQTIHACRPVSVRVLRTAVREWACCSLEVVWVVLGFSTDPDRSYYFTNKKFPFEVNLPFYRIIIIITTIIIMKIIVTQHKSHTTCPISEFVIRFLYLLYRVIPHYKWRLPGFVFHNTTTRYFRTLIIMITSHQDYMSVPVA